jgi:aminoglycoside/choline kinase family phosphotransferase
VQGVQTRIARWLTSSQSKSVDILPLWGDVSRRRYFRVTFDNLETAIAVSYPDDMRPVCSRFLVTTALLGTAGVRVPRVLRSTCDQGLMLVEDLGSTSLYDLSGRAWDDLMPLFSQAQSYLESIQRLPEREVSGLNPPLDGMLLRQEIDLSWRALVEHGMVSAPPFLQKQFKAALATLCDQLDNCPLVPCHRDFMGRNLMLTEPDRLLAVIDHQDLRLGPELYDLASLLNDSLFPPPAIETRLRSASIEGENALLLYRRCAVQRTVKAAGTFVRFAAQGDKRHLPLVPATLQRAAYHLRYLPEGGSFADDLSSHWESTAKESL